MIATISILPWFWVGFGVIVILFFVHCAVNSAPEGYENEHGFNYGRE